MSDLDRQVWKAALHLSRWVGFVILGFPTGLVFGAIFRSDAASMIGGVTPLALGIFGLVHMAVSPTARADFAQRQLDTRNRARRRELERQVISKDRATRKVYERLKKRTEELGRLAAKKSTRLQRAHVRSFDEAVLRFLEYWRSSFLLSKRVEGDGVAELRQRLAEVEVKLSEATSDTVRTSLSRTREDLEAVIARHEELESDLFRLRAMMSRIEVELDALYTRVVADPSGEGVGAELSRAVEELRRDTEVDRRIEHELRQLEHGTLT